MLVRPIAFGSCVVVASKECGVLLPEHLLDLISCPDVKLALDAFTVRVEAGAKAAARRAHFPPQPLDGLAHGLLEDRFPCVEPGKRQQFEKLRVVVEHLLEVRHEPSLVDRVAREAASELVVDAALAHPAQSQQEGPAGCSIPRACSVAPEEFEHGGIGEFRRSPQPAIHAVHATGQALRVEVERRGCDLPIRRGRLGVEDGRAQRLGVLRHRFRLGVIGPRDGSQDVDEGGPSKACLLRKIRAAPERFAGRRQEHGQRPTARLIEGVKRRHVDLVDVGALFTVDLDVDEEFVHHRGDTGIFEALMSHDVAPVAGRVADGEQDRLVESPCFRERRLSPHPPVDRIVLMLEQVGADRGGEFVLRHETVLDLGPSTLPPVGYFLACEGYATVRAQLTAPGKRQNSKYIFAPR